MRKALFSDFDAFNHHRLYRAVTGSGGGCGDGVHNFLGLWVSDLTENGVMVGQVTSCVRIHSDEELRTVGAGASIGHGQQVRTVKAQLGVELVGELVAGATATGAGGVAALDHEAINDTVEDRPVIEWTLSIASGIRGLVLLRALSQPDKIFNSHRGMVSKKLNGNITTIGVHNRRSGFLCHAHHRNEHPSCCHPQGNIATLDENPPKGQRMTPQTVRLAYKTGKTAYRTFKDYRNRKTAEAYDATSEVLNDAANTYHSLRANVRELAGDIGEELNNRRQELVKETSATGKKLSRAARRKAAKLEKRAAKKAGKKKCCRKVGKLGKFALFGTLFAGIAGGIYYWWARSTAEEPGTEPPRVEEHSRDDYVESRLVYTTQTPEDNDEK